MRSDPHSLVDTIVSTIVAGWRKGHGSARPFLSMPPTACIYAEGVNDKLKHGIATGVHPDYRQLMI
jgi:hypothetical protein